MPFIPSLYRTLAGRDIEFRFEEPESLYINRSAHPWDYSTRIDPMTETFAASAVN